MNRSGFTTLEVLIASALIITLVTGGAVGLRQMNTLNHLAATRTSHTEMRTRILGWLNDSGSCAAQLGNPVREDVVPIPPIPIDAIKDGVSGLVLLERGKREPNQIVWDGMLYDIAVTFPVSNIEYTFGSGLGRSKTTERYAIDFEVRGRRDRMQSATNQNFPDVVTRIPMVAEFDSVSHRMVSCTVHPGEIDDLLTTVDASGKVTISKHTVRECLLIDGMPIQTDVGLICRIPIFNPPQMGSNYSGQIPRCKDIAPGWTEPNKIQYSTTLPIKIPKGHLVNCQGTFSAETDWHSMSNLPVEKETVKIKKGTKPILSAILGGTALTGIVFTIILATASFIPVTALLIAAIATTVVLIAFVISLFKKCKTENFSFYSQVNGIGCI